MARAMDQNQAMERASHPKPGVLSDFILGSQDGIVNVLGIILGLSAATRDVRIILVATLAALGAESIAMGAVAYNSTRARRRLYLSQVVQERREMVEVPQTERDEGREILAGGGYKDAGLEESVERSCVSPTADCEVITSVDAQLSSARAWRPGPDGGRRFPGAAHARPDGGDHCGHRHRRVLFAPPDRGPRERSRGAGDERPR